MNRDFVSPFPTETLHDFEPTHVTLATGDYLYTFIPAGDTEAAMQEFVNDLRRWYSGLQAGRYHAFFDVCYESGDRRRIEGREVSAPMRNNVANNIGDELLDMIGEYINAVDSPLDGIRMFVMSKHGEGGGGITDVELADEPDKPDEPPSKSQKRGASSSQAGSSSRASSSRAVAPSHGSKPSGPKGRTRQLLNNDHSSLYRAAAIAKYPNIEYIERIDSPLQALSAVSIKNIAAAPADASEEDRIAALESQSFRVNVFQWKDGCMQQTRASKLNQGFEVNLLKVGAREYKQIPNLAAFRAANGMDGFTCCLGNSECCYVDRSFKSKQKRDQHEKSKTCLFCQMCAKRFTTVEDLDDHRKQSAIVPCNAEKAEAAMKLQPARLAQSNNRFFIFDFEALRGTEAQARLGLTKEGLQHPSMAVWQPSNAMKKLLQDTDLDFDKADRQALNGLCSGDGQFWTAFTPRVGTEEGSAADLLLTFVDKLEAVIAEKQAWERKADNYAIWKTVRMWFITQCEHGPQWKEKEWRTWETKHGVEHFIRFSEENMLPLLEEHDYIHKGKGALVQGGSLNSDWLLDNSLSKDLQSGVTSVSAELREEWRAGCIESYRSNNGVNFFAHNSSKYDSVLLLRQFIARRARMGKAWERDVKVLRNHGAFLEVRIGIVTFRDTIRQLPSSLDDLCESFQLSADESKLKGAWPHTAFKPVLKGDTSSEQWPAPWTNEELLCKPPRRLFEHNVKVGPMEVKLRRPIDEEAYRTIPGRDPDGELHGEGTCNPYQECLDYCKQDVSSLMIIWEKWREGVRQMTEVTGFDAPHEPLVPKKVVAIDPGTVNLGYCVLAADGTLLQCGRKDKVGNGIATVVSELVGDDDVYVIVEDQPKDNKHTFPQMQILLVARPSTRVVDANYKFALAGKEVQGVMLPPHRLGLGHEANKQWARDCAKKLRLEVARGKVDDAADAFLLAEWFRRTHLVGGTDAGTGACAACTERWNTHGADPNNYLSIGQLAESMFKTQLVCKPCSDESQEAQEVEIDKLGIEIVKRAANRTCGRYITEDVHIPILQADKEKFCRLASRGGRCEVFHRMAEIIPKDGCCETCGDQMNEMKMNDGTCLACMTCRTVTEAPKDDWTMEYRDACSLYPAVMTYDHAVGPGVWVCDLNSLCDRLNLQTSSFFGYVEVELETPKDQWLPCLGEHAKINGARKQVFRNSDLPSVDAEKEAYVVFSEQLKQAVVCGYKVKRVVKALRFEKEPYMRKFINQIFRYKCEQDAWKNAKDPRYNAVLRQCYKLILNNIFGRMLMAQPDVDVKIVSFPDLMNLEPRLVYRPRLVTEPDANSEGGIYVVEIRAAQKKRNNHLSPSGGAAVLAYGQMRIFAFAQEVLQVGGKPLYMDTDSVIFARPSSSAIDPSWLGSNLGLFKDELEDKVKKHNLGRLLGFVAVTQKLYAFQFEAGWRHYKESGKPLTAEEWARFEVIACKGCRIGANLDVVHYDSLRSLVTGENVAGLDVKKTQMRRSADLEVSWMDGNATLRGVLDKRTSRVDTEGRPRIEVDRCLRFIATDPLGQPVASS